MLYGTMDVPLCPEALVAEVPMYRALAATAAAPGGLGRDAAVPHAADGGGAVPRRLPGAGAAVEPDLIEQDLGEWQGLAHADLPPSCACRRTRSGRWRARRCRRAARAWWSVIARVGPAMERLACAHAGEDVVVVSHGGAIRAAVAHAIGIGADNALHLSVQNVSLTRLERQEAGWRVVCVNQVCEAARTN